MKTYRDFWYIIADAKELKPGSILSREILDEHLVCFRGINGRLAVFRDRCLHRCGRLSKGVVSQNSVHCPYHGWVYDQNGNVTDIPSMGGPPPKNLRAVTYPVREQDGYIYVCLSHTKTDSSPFKMKYFKKTGWGCLRLQNLFNSRLSDCVENFIDVPHTAFVHRGIFRTKLGSFVRAKITRDKGRVDVVYENEKKNLGSFNRILNPRGKPILHTDTFLMPNITFVRYALPGKWQYVITSQSVPVSREKTLVYTEISYQFGLLTPFIGWLIRRQAQKVIDQDVRVLADQLQVIKKYGAHFYDTPSDLIHRLITQIHDALDHHQDPDRLPAESTEIEFFI